MARVVCVGISVLDHVFTVDRLPEARVKHYARGRLEVTGGIAANAALAVVRLGGAAALVSRVGDDLAGRAVGQALAAEGVDTQALHVLPGARTSLSAVIIDPTGERMVVNDTDPRTLRGLDGVPEAAFRGADAVLADTRWADGALLAVRRAKSLAVPGVLDFDRVPDHGGTGDLLAAASHVVFGRQGLATLAGTEDVGAGLRHARDACAEAGNPGAWLAVTAGDEGAYWLADDGRVRRAPGFAVEVVDTLAAGDVFHGAFALALAERRPEESALRFANAAAALKCSRPGGGAGAPRRAEIEAFLEGRG